MVKKIGFLGCPGTGKSSTARILAGNCRRIDKHKNVELVCEYARRYINKVRKFGDIGLCDQHRILEKQIEWEDSVPSESTDILITDSPLFIGYAYSLEILEKLEETGEKNGKHVMFMNDLYKKMSKLNLPRRYSIIFYLPPVIKPVRDGIRPDSNFDDEWRLAMNKKLEVAFTIFRPEHFVPIASVDINVRVQECIENINRLL